MATKVYPLGSYLLREHSNMKKNMFWLKFWGWTCMPCCCMGCICILPAKLYEDLVKDVSKIVKIYTAPFLNKLAKGISDQQKIFLEATLSVNSTTTKIFPDVSLLDVLYVAQPNIQKMMPFDYNYKLFDALDEKNVDKKKYIMDIYKVYKGNGGDENYIIFGLPEYLARFHDISSNFMLKTFKLISSETQLSVFIFSHKASVFPEDV